MPHSLNLENIKDLQSKIPLVRNFEDPPLFSLFFSVKQLTCSEFYEPIRKEKNAWKIIIPHRSEHIHAHKHTYANTHTKKQRILNHIPKISTKYSSNHISFQTYFIVLFSFFFFLFCKTIA